MPPAFSSLPKNPVIDASMLFDFLVWRLPSDFRNQIIARSRAATTRNTPEKVIEGVDLRRVKELGWYLGAAKPIQTSSQVVAEIQGLAKSRLRLEGARLERFWRLVRQEFEQIELKDQSVSMADMDYDDFVRYGPADASILKLATQPDNAVLVNDRALRHRCIEREIGVLNYDDVVSLWQQFGA